MNREPRLSSAFLVAARYCSLSRRESNSANAAAFGSTSVIVEDSKMLVVNARFVRPSRLSFARRIHCAAASTSVPRPRVIRTGVPREQRTQNDGLQPRINVIEESQWSDGVPAVQGAHLMASGTVSPISTSKDVLEAPTHMFRYPDGATTCALVQFPGEIAAADGLAAIVSETAKQSIEQKGTFNLVLSGGSLVNLLGKLGDRNSEWEKWHVFWVDERVVPHSDPDSNYKGAVEAFLSKVDIPKSNIHAIAEGVSAAAAATHYEGVLIEHATRKELPTNESGFPVFDLILLGVGPDGHVASLFPNGKQTAEAQKWILPIEDSPKPPSQRITMTLPVINAAQKVVIVALGESKAEIVQRVLEVQSLPGALPAQMVRPASSDLTWILDGGSSKMLRIHEWEQRLAFPRNES